MVMLQHSYNYSNCQPHCPEQTASMLPPYTQKEIKMLAQEKFEASPGQLTKEPKSRWSPLSKDFRVGIIASSPFDSKDKIMAVENAASSCDIRAVAILNQKGVSMQDWRREHGVRSCEEIYIGEDGVEKIMMAEYVDGVFITGDIEDKLSLVERCLQAGKHVLVDDPITSDVNEYCRLITLAHESKRHLQDSTMFIHHHAVREFLECVLNKDEFGEITKINTCFDINPDDPRYRGILVDPKKFVNKDRRGCIATLCRYCAVLGILIFQRSGRRALTAQVTNIELDDCGHPAHCICKIKFEGGAVLTIDCSYIEYAGTRQSVDVHSPSHTASMSDFVFSSRSLACYRLYEKYSVNGAQLVRQGKSIDVEGGPLPEVCVWRRFAELSMNAYEADVATECHFLFDQFDFTISAIQSQNIVSSLMKSADNGCIEIQLPDLDLAIPYRSSC